MLAFKFCDNLLTRQRIRQVLESWNNRKISTIEVSARNQYKELLQIKSLLSENSYFSFTVFAIFRCLLTAAFELIFHSSPDSPPAIPKSVALSPQPVINSSTLCGLRFKTSHRCTRMAGNKPQTPNLLCFCGKRVLQRRGNNRRKW